MQEVWVLRLGHRKERDKRITTHCCLVARAFLAKGIVICGGKDGKLIENIKKICERWGGRFDIKYERSWKDTLEEFRERGFKIVHLTMYGLPLTEKLKELKSFDKILVAIGSEKVPREIYELADYNIAITNQPHSEVAALAIFLHELFEGKEFSAEFEDAKMKIIPQSKGKKVVKLS
jgi:tRNA (cytidine56-2'-O)-methyltransferase